MINLYASPTGNGTGLSVGSPASVADVKTLARTYLESQTDNVTIWLRGGKYEIDTSLSFTTPDSGSNGYKVEWRGYADDLIDENPPIFSGGIGITGWTLHDYDKNIWKSTLPSGLSFRQIYVNGTRATRSHLSTSLLNTLTTIDEAHTFTTSSTLPTFSRPQDLELAMLTRPWCQSKVGISSIGVNGGVTTLNIEVIDHWAWGSPQSGIPDYIENAYEFLTVDTKGNWYFNNDTDVLYYVPLDGENMETVEVIVPIVDKLIDTSSSSPLSNVQFFDIEFRHSNYDFRTTQDYFLHGQAAIFILTNGSFSGRTSGCIELKKSEYVSVENCRFDGVGGSGVFIGSGSKHCSVRNNYFDDIAANGIHIGEVDTSSPTTANQISYHDISNNYITNVGTDYVGSCAIFTTYTDNTLIKHNEIFDVTYSAISLGWGWLNSGYANSNNISYNKLHKIMTVLHDGAGIYTLGKQGSASNYCQITDNYISDVGVYGESGTYPVAGLYADQGSHYIDFDNNVIVKGELGREGIYWFNANASEDYQTGYFNISDTYRNSDSLYNINSTEYDDGEGGTYWFPLYDPINVTNTVVLNDNPELWDENAISIANNSGTEVLIFGQIIEGSLTVYGWRTSPTKHIEFTLPENVLLEWYAEPYSDTWVAELSGVTTENISGIYAEETDSQTFIIDSVQNTSTIENISIVFNGSEFVIGDIVSGTDIENVSLEFNGGTFIIDNIETATSSENISIIEGEYILFIDNIQNGINIDEIILQQGGSLFNMANAPPLLYNYSGVKPELYNLSGIKIY